MCKIIPCFQKLRVYPCYDNPNNIRSFPLYRKILMIYIYIQFQYLNVSFYNNAKCLVYLNSFKTLRKDVKGSSKTILYYGKKTNLSLFACLFASFRPN